MVFNPANAAEFDDDAIILLHWECMSRQMVIAVPLGILRRDANASMYGGCHVHTSDSRFPFFYPVPLHDRVEW